MDIMKILETRRSYRRFDQERNIEIKAIEDMKQAARMASCAKNMQPLRYLFITETDMVNKIFPFTTWAARLSRADGEPKEGEKPVMFILVLYAKNDESKWIDTDAGLAISNITLAAWSHGVGSCILDNINRDEIRKICNISEDTIIQSAIGLGYPTHKSNIVSVGRDENLDYSLDENRDYKVPKRSTEDIITCI